VAAAESEAGAEKQHGRVQYRFYRKRQSVVNRKAGGSRYFFMLTFVS
jgi:hypothetical protein